VSKILAALLFPVLMIPALCRGAILPQFVGTLEKTSSKPLPVEDKPVWDEYGLQDSEQATYEGGGKTLTVRAYRLQDATGALAAYQWQRPAGARAADDEMQELSKLSAVTAGTLTIALGNHLLILTGPRPTAIELGNVFRSMPHQEAGPLPTLPEHLPEKGLIPDSERYIIGPASLAKFEPEVSPAQAAFHLGTEIQTGTYQTPGGEMKLAIFSVPSPELGRMRIAELNKIPGMVAKRSGPLVAAIYEPKDANEAEKLLAQVRFQAEVTTGQKPPSKKDNFGDFLLNLAILIGIVVVFAVMSGLLFGGYRYLFRRGGASGDGEAVISLHLED
jgi:hypothetical protein